MVSRIGAHLRGNVVAYIAVFLALGGTAVAANKIGTKQLKNNAVKTKKIANGAVTNPKIAGNAVTGAKVANGTLGAGELASGAIVAKAYATANADPVGGDPATLVPAGSNGVNAIDPPISGEDGVACVDVARPFTVALATGRDEVGAASPVVFASVNYSPDSGGIDCPDGSDVRVTTEDEDNANPVDADFTIVFF